MSNTAAATATKITGEHVSLPALLVVLVLTYVWFFSQVATYIG